MRDPWPIAFRPTVHLTVEWDSSDPLLRMPITRPAPWYAVQVKAQREFHVVRELDRYKFESYLPTRTRKHWRNSQIEVPLIPGYVFARGEVGEIYAALRWTGWITSILANDAGPVEIPAAQIETLRIMVDHSKIEIVPLTDIWQGGEEVEVVTGPLTGARGRVARVKGHTHLVIFIEMLGSAISTEIEADCVRALTATAPVSVEVPLAA